MKQIGLLGGSFNPIHEGHLALAREAQKTLLLDQVIFIPSYRPPHKTEELVDATHRYKMVRLAIQGEKTFSLSDLEIKRKGTSYTIDTVKALQQERPDAAWTFLVGSDCLQTIQTWKSVEELFQRCAFAVATRPHFPLEKIPKGFKTIQTTQVNISSEEIRRKVSQGESVADQVPRAVVEYIQEHQLYR